MTRNFEQGSGWIDEALCRGASEVFFPDALGRGQNSQVALDAYEENEAAALRICNGDPELGTRPCPVRAECLGTAFRDHEIHGVWGGKTPRQRKALINLGRATL